KFTSAQKMLDFRRYNIQRMKTSELLVCLQASSTSEDIFESCEDFLC
ncbi:hypothetical protein A2U01_0044983, partial [Trifolium medium]|nr:hypothetical protein [Trifolium medium]